MPYTRPYPGGFQDFPNTGTPINALSLNTIDLGVKTVSDTVDALTGALTAYTPTLAQGVSTNITKNLSLAKYAVVGKTMFLWLRIGITGTGTAGSAITVTIPTAFTADAAIAGQYVGTGAYGDSGTGDYFCLAKMNSTTQISLVQATHNNGAAPIGIFPNIAAANNDSFSVTATIPLA